MKIEVADVFEKWMKKIREEAAAAMEVARDMKKYYDKGRQDALKCEIRDQVYLEVCTFPLTDHQRNWKTDSMALPALLQK